MNILTCDVGASEPVIGNIAMQGNLGGPFSFVPPRTFFIPNFCALPTRSYGIPEITPTLPAAKASGSKRIRKKPIKPVVETFTFKENVPQKFVPLLQRLPTLLLQQPKQIGSDSTKPSTFNLVAVTKVGEVSKFVPLNKISFPPTMSNNNVPLQGFDNGNCGVRQFHSLNESIAKQPDHARSSSLFYPKMDEREHLLECYFSVSNPTNDNSMKRTKSKAVKKPPQPRSGTRNAEKKVAKRKETVSQVKKEVKRQLVLTPRLCPKETIINFQTFLPMNGALGN